MKTEGELMGIQFNRSRMEEVIENHERWWNKKLDRPLIKGTIQHAHPLAHGAVAPRLSQENSTDFSWTAEQIIETLDAHLSTQEFFADGYPRIGLTAFGPGVVAAFCGSPIDTTDGRIWFLPKEEDLTKLHVTYDPDNRWSRRIKDIYKAGFDRWEGSVVMEFPDLGGVMDVLASLCGTDNLLYALIDQPEEVSRLVKETEIAWNAAFDDFASILKPQGVYSDWNGILSREPSYITQCDFSYMIGPDMFREFVLETLKKDTEKMSNVIYHLDGIGELPHLDMILGIEKLKAVQWVPGAGQPDTRHWLDVYQRILDAGKQIHLVDEHFMEVTKELNCNPYVTLSIDAREQNKDDVLRKLNF